MERPIAAAGQARAWVFPAPAKLNLFLHVLGRRDDGYHELQTVFQLLDWGDEVSLRLRDDGVVRMARAVPGVPDESNLALRAALALRHAAAGGWGVDIEITKRIPIGGGLGGASSDAATVLLGLDRLTGASLGVERLAGLALGLGADVPLFVRGRSAWAEGVGERLVPIDLPGRWFLVLYPGVAVSTAAVFTDPRLTRDTTPMTISCFLGGEGSRNDLELAATALAPEVGRAIGWLSGFAPARLSGSGSCVFAAFVTREAADAVAAQVPEAWRAHVAHSVAESPLHREIRRFQKLQWDVAKSG